MGGVPGDPKFRRNNGMLEVLRNLARRKLRSTLTISGIVIGIFALTAMGSMAEHFNALLSGGVQYASSGAQVGPPAGQQAAMLPLATEGRLKAVSGVAAVFPRYSVEANPGGGINFGPPDLIVNEDLDAAAYSSFKLTIAQGRNLTASSTGEVVLGSSIATELKKRSGDSVDLPVRPKDAGPTFVNHTYKVVGILAPTGTVPDSEALVGDSDARALEADSLPAAVRSAIDVNQVAPAFTVFAAPGSSLAALDQLAGRINAEVPGVKAARPSEMVNQIKSINTTFTAVTTGAALLALIIGGLSVVNTMVMAVSERVREIGLKKALGARTAHLMREYLLEAAMIGFIGGAVGFLLGAGAISLADFAGKSGNFDLFLVTPRLAVLSIGFATALGALAGIVPALRAARMEPVAALRNSN
jgi:putative ABC transport system permease protein